MMDMLPGTEIVAVGARKEKKDDEDFGRKHGGRSALSKRVWQSSNLCRIELHPWLA